MLVHLAFDLLAWIAGGLAAWLVRRRYLAGLRSPMPEALAPCYLLLVALGALVGALVLGTLNLMLAGQPGIGRSVLGALFGGVLAAEAFKLGAGVRGSTGLVFVAPFAVGVAVGRVGCFLAGLPDFTYGTPSDLPWAWDFGDGVPRHPVQLYESLAMLLFLGWFLAALQRGSRFVLANGFYLFVAWTAAQRFLWEAIKPHPPVLGPLTMFQVVCLALLLYAAGMLRLEAIRAARA
jgi:prolipoprotein diacylglyceryltransferase